MFCLARIFLIVIPLVFQMCRISHRMSRLVFICLCPSLFCLPQLYDRLLLFAMPPKHQPDFIYLRHVPLRKVHLFTVTQLTCLVLLWVIKTSPAAIVFPMMVQLL